MDKQGQVLIARHIYTVLGQCYTLRNNEKTKHVLNIYTFKTLKDKLHEEGYRGG